MSEIELPLVDVGLAPGWRDKAVEVRRLQKHHGLQQAPGLSGPRAGGSLNQRAKGSTG